jgi:hypothetical protein
VKLDGLNPGDEFPIAQCKTKFEATEPQTESSLGRPSIKLLQKACFKQASMPMVEIHLKSLAALM